MFNFIVYHLVSFIIDLASAEYFQPEKYAGMTLVSSAKLVSRIERHYAEELQVNNIRVVAAEHHFLSFPQGKSLHVLAFKHSAVASESSGSMGSQ